MRPSRSRRGRRPALSMPRRPGSWRIPSMRNSNCVSTPAHNLSPLLLRAHGLTMNLNVAVQMDPISRINIRGDSTFALLLEAQKRGHGLSYYTPDKLSLRGEEVVAPIQVLSVRDESGDHFTLGEPKRESLAA